MRMYIGEKHMLVIRQGIHNNWPKQFECVHCKAILEVCKIDVKKEKNTYYLTCPECSHDILVNKNNMEIE